MTLFKLGINNVKHNFKNYISYFISILTSVFILMIFYSIYYNDHIQSFSSKRIKVITIFKIAAFIVIIFSSIFIWYANSFFIKNKKKEVAIYSLVGMKKREIGRLMFFENIFLGVLALIIGIPLGIFSSTFFLKILSMCIKSAVPIKYNFNIKAVVVTFFIFIIIFLLNSIKAYKIIYKFKLIELLHAEKEGEKQPKFSKILAVVSIVMLLSGYGIALTIDVENTGGAKLIIYGTLIMTLVIVGIYILFNNFIIYGLKLIEKNKKLYYRGENLIGISQIVYRIKGNCNLLATIAVILSVAITALCFTFSFNMVLDEAIPNGSPFSVMYRSGDESLDRKVEDIINNEGDENITYKNDIKAIEGEAFTEKYSGPSEMFLISLSEYNEIIENSYFNNGTGISQRISDVNINNQNQCFFMEVSNLPEGRKRLAGEEAEVSIGEQKYKFEISDSDIKGVLGVKLQKTTIVVGDELFNELLEANKNNVTVIRVYNFNNILKNEKIVEDIREIMPSDSKFSSYYSIYMTLHSLYGSFIFIGIFLGILFVLSTGSIMYYKQVMEANEDKNRYIILSKIGLSRKEILRIIIKQIGFIFIIPLFFAIINSVAALGAYVNYMIRGGDGSGYIIKCIVAMMGIYILIYLFYYLLSVKSYMKIIRNNPV